MMFSFNPNYIISLLLGLILYFSSLKYFRGVSSTRNKFIIFIVSLILALLSLSIPAAYFSDKIGENPTYTQFRTFSYTELIVALIGPFFGIVTSYFVTRKGKAGSKHAIYRASLLVMLFYISLPFIKPIIRPLATQNISDQWKENVALQTTSSTCGPASLATIMKYYDKTDTEGNIAQHAFSSSTGTENWYLARYAQSQGFSYQFLHQPDLSQVPIPSIIGTNLGRVGHFVTVLGFKNDIYTIGDSLNGLNYLTLTEFNRRYHFDGFVLHLKPIAS